MDEQDRRARVRQRYGARCGPCGVHETEAGSELEIDHFQPRSAGGADDLDNLVYCCPACNRHKADFWPASRPRNVARRLLHPGHDAMNEHLREEDDGRITALSVVGAFHIERLRLNRPPLVALRLARQDATRIRVELHDSLHVQKQLRARLAALEQEIQALLTRIDRLLEP